MRYATWILAAAILVGGAKADDAPSPLQAGDAYILFNVDTGEFRMCPGHDVADSAGVNSFGVEMDPAIGTLSKDVNDYYFPSGTWPLFYPHTGAEPGNAFCSAFHTWSLPNVTSGGDSLNSKNLVIGSPWTVQVGGKTGSTGAEIPGTTAVYASMVPGYEGLPEFSLGTFGPTNLTAAQALASLGATSEGDFATGNRVYTLKSVTGTQFFKIYTTTAARQQAPDSCRPSLPGSNACTDCEPQPDRRP